jgi:xylitol oxidase
MVRTQVGTNWSGNYAYRAHALHRPQTLGELQDLVAGPRSVRALGSRHSFTAIADGDELVALDALPGVIEIDSTGETVSVPGHTTYAVLAEELSRHGRALHSMASLPHISVAGAIATATHGSGDDTGNLATAVRAVEMVSPAGEHVRVAEGDADFEGVVVGLGCLGVVTRVTLAVQPFFEMRQLVFEGVGWDRLLERLDEIFSAGESVSVFHRCAATTEQVWVKRREYESREDDGDLAELLGIAAATAAVHPVPGADPVNCTEQLGAPGPWSERLPHFRSGFTPSSGEELQSEFFVARADAVAAIEVVRGLAEAIVPHLLVSELRTIAGDALWLSPQQGRDTLAIHFTWRRRPAEVEAVVSQIEAGLARFAARPHWGKVFTAEAAALAPLYPRMAAFRDLRERMDPNRAFVNDWLRQRVLGSA